MFKEMIAVWPHTEWVDGRSVDIYRVIQQEGLIFWEVIVWVSVRRKFIGTCV
jgi:hypothetical protein